ncbi:MAG: hypothetical protein AMK71_05460 [Nitrospira bacterium SG8_35_4]|nr:MAG: hypothetical protein AMK71_05460 [Nitrospira bacterium SG8_35_4]
MLGNANKNSALRYSRFGQLAVKRGFVTIKQLNEALSEQIANDPFHRLRCRKRVGEIFFERGWMNSRQIQMVLEELSEH